MSLNLSVFLDSSARTCPDREAVVLGDVALTYSEVDGLACRVANLLHAHGVRPGDKVVMTCPNVVYFPIVYYGILKAGAVVVPLNVLLKRREIAYHLNDCDAKAYFCFEGTPELPLGEEGRAAFDLVEGCTSFFMVPGGGALEPSEACWPFLDALAAQPTVFETVPTDPADTAVILYTSGTTGRPKGAELSHANMVMNALSCDRLFDARPAEPDTHLVVLPLFHSFGQTVNMNAGFSMGATLVLLPRFDAEEALRLMALHRVSVFAGVPTMYWALLGESDAANAGVIAGTIRKAISGGASMPAEIQRRFQERFGVQVLEGYGLSETSPVAIFSDPASQPRPGSIGVPLWGIEVKLIDPGRADDWYEVEGADQVGEIAIKGHNVMKGYFQRPEDSAAVLRNGWFRSGDLARRDEDGWYYIVDRVKDLIIRGGLNVYPREVEEVLVSHEAVSLVAVVGVPDERHGEEIKAFVIRHPGAQIGETELVAWAKDQMAAYKYPRIVTFVDSLPMTATGKILKRELVGWDR